MQVDITKLESIGIDRIVLNNLKVLNFDDLEKETRYTQKKEIVEKVEYTEFGVFSMSYTRNSRDTGDIYDFSTLELNPSKIINGHNVYNSNLAQLKESIEIVLKKLSNIGIEIDITEAKIKEIELDTTIVADFETLQEVVLLIGRANYKKALVISSFRNEDIPRSIKKDRSLYLNSKISDFKKGNTGKVIKLYDKTFEMYLNHNIMLDKQLTRIEVLFGQDYFRNVMERTGLDNSLKTFLLNDVLEDIFLKSLVNEMLTKPVKYLKKIKKNLAFEFNNFRRNERVKRQFRKKLKQQGKEIPAHYREERGVFKHLQNESWIFDFSFLVELVNEHVPVKHKGIFEKQILKNYIHVANLSLYEFLLKKIFGENFYTSCSTLSGYMENRDNAEL